MELSPRSGTACVALVVLGKGRSWTQPCGIMGVAVSEDVLDDEVWLEQGKWRKCPVYCHLQ